MSRPDSLKILTLKIADIYVPTKRRKLIEPQKVDDLAQDILENSQISPILVRKDDARYVLVEGLHRLEACKALGEEEIFTLIVQARKH
jgi:ParB-like chromosome segregation protein Spo0J